MKPTFLNVGDTIGIVATARYVDESEIMPTVEALSKYHFKIKLGSNLFLRENQYAGAERARIEDMQEMLDDSEVKAILCARGGYGTVRIIDYLDFSNFLSYPKWICGFSDVTVLHSHIYQNFHLPTIHSFMPINIENSDNSSEELDTFLKAITGQSISYSFATHPLNRNGEVTAPIVGGNLSVLYSLLGSPSDIDTEGKILFIEDLDEYLYHIDRMMMNLKRNGKLDKLAGLLVGYFSDMHDNIVSFGKNAEEIIAEHCANFDFPIAFNFPAGHLSPNCALRLGETIQLQVQNGKQTNVIF